MHLSVNQGAVKMLLLLVLPLVCSAYDYDAQQLTDPDLVGDIFGTQQVAEPYSAPVPQETRCDELRPCVECSVFHQYWKHFSSAYECYENCKQFSFVTQPTEETICTLDYSPVCGIDGKQYSNACSARNINGVGVACQGECPCSSAANVCEFKGNLDGDTICKAYKFVIEDPLVYVFRPPCLADDLEVNKGIWNGEVVVSGLDTFPNGWGILTYLEGDHLNRDKYDGNMVYGVMQGYGTLFWKDGSYYSGQFLDNSKAGEGTLFYSNGDIFTGSWVDEKKTGQGKYMFSKGGEYNGGFSSGAQDGEGEFNILHPDDAWEHYKGQYEGGVRKTGSYKLTTGDKYEGDFSTGLGAYGGQGKYIWSCEKVYTGHFKAGKPDGEGVMDYPEGWRYEGHFVDGKFDGHGKFTWGPDNYFEGEFLNGEMTGNGLYYLAGGGLYDSSVGLYYPQAGNKEEFFEAHFDGKTLRYKEPVRAKGKKGGY
eukprot:GFUD01018826.1.p1 GENE.GFUD01018826.1~~GFUD01018826.1.p1  ORF type:complete len:479 (-),score=119.91 GFUD01018826.1:155-1591(-)